MSPRIRRRKPARIEANLVCQHIALAGQIEIGMAGEIAEGRRVGRRGKINPQFIFIREPVSGLDREIARKTFFAVLAQIDRVRAPDFPPNSTTFASQTTLSKPLTPPWRELAPLFWASV